MEREDQHIGTEWGRPSAFIVYQPHREKAPEAALCDLRAWQILTHPAAGSQHKEFSRADLPALCKRWSSLLEQRSNRAEDKTGNPSDSFFIDLFISGRRRYRVKGFRLYDQSGLAGQKRAYFMFTFERIHRDSVNFSQIFRESKLSKREQDIVHQILAGKSNKEIAEALGLSLNTVKVYLKNLMRRINVTSRAGIVSFLLLKPLDKRQ